MRALRAKELALSERGPEDGAAAVKQLREIKDHLAELHEIAAECLGNVGKLLNTAYRKPHAPDVYDFHAARRQPGRTRRWSQNRSSRCTTST